MEPLLSTKSNSSKPWCWWLSWLFCSYQHARLSSKRSPNTQDLGRMTLHDVDYKYAFWNLFRKCLWVYWSNLVNIPFALFHNSNAPHICICHDSWVTVYPKKYAHGFCFAVLCCGYTLTDFPLPIRLTSLALWQSNDCPSASKATLMNMDKYFMWIHYERLHNHNKAKHNKTVCIFLGIYCIMSCANCELILSVFVM